jgi:hypothetical protein
MKYIICDLYLKFQDDDSDASDNFMNAGDDQELEDEIAKNNSINNLLPSGDVLETLKGVQ